MTIRPTGRSTAVPTKAVYVYAQEDLSWWTVELDQTVAPGILDAPELAGGWLDWAHHVLGYRIESDPVPPAEA